MPVNLSNYQQVNADAKSSAPLNKWNPETMPEFIGTYLGTKIINYNGETFTRLMFSDAVNNITDEPITGELSCKDYAQLKLKLGSELVGKRLGITWLGLKPHPKYPAKSLHTFAVAILPNEVAPQETYDAPF
jgi:hypothetical protein